MLGVEERSMIINRLANGIRNQDWFVVIIEVMIVVVGLFIGLQVDDWNQARIQRLEEHQYLERLYSDMRKQIEQMDIRETYFEVAKADNILITDYLTAPDESSLPATRLLSAFYISTVIYPFRPYSVTYEELLSTGKIQILSDVGLRELIAQYFYDTEPLLGAWNIPNDNTYRNAVRSRIPPALQDLISTTCEPANGNMLKLEPDCAIDIPQDKARDIVANLTNVPGLKETAMLNLSRLIIALRLYNANTATAQNVLDALVEAKG
jgi:hypothetical protein